MKNAKPLVSILLPVRNCQKNLTACLESLRTQTYKNVEIIAVDDKSCDTSLKILKQERSRDKRIRIISNKKQYGVSVCLNRAASKAKGDFLAFMDTNDVSKKSRIQKQINFLIENKKVVAVGTNAELIDKKGNKHGKFVFPKDNRDIYKRLMSGLSMQFETTMINRTLLPKDIIYFEKNTYPFYFSELFVKLSPYGLFANIDKSLYYIYYKRYTLTSTWQKIKQYPSLIKLFLKSKTLYHYNGSIWSIFLPLKTLITTR